MPHIFVYKQDHLGDPDHDLGVFGVADCLGSDRISAARTDAVVAVMHGELSWVGLHPKIIGWGRGHRGPLLAFRHYQPAPPGLVYPALSSRLGTLRKFQIIPLLSGSSTSALNSALRAILEIAVYASRSKAIDINIEIIIRDIICKPAQEEELHAGSNRYQGNAATAKAQEG